MLFRIDSTSLLIEFSLEELMAIIQSILQTKGFYYRLISGFSEPSQESIQRILHSHRKQITSEYSDKSSIFENTIDALMDHACSLAGRLSEAEEKVRGLRQALANISGPEGLTGNLR